MRRRPSHQDPVLIIDDDEDCRIIFSLALRQAGYTVVTAADGEEGLSCAKQQGPALILMDLAMPGISGVEALERLKADPALAAIPVVALTAAATNLDDQSLRDKGFDAVVIKPITPNDLVTLVARYQLARFPAS
jgi:CheY-like chemotaxis protein